jgi:hypothetical protein
MLDDLSRHAPGGRWRAVNALRGRCVVVIARDGDVDLALTIRPAFRLPPLPLCSGSAVSSPLPVVTNLAE